MATKSHFRRLPRWIWSSLRALLKKPLKPLNTQSPELWCSKPDEIYFLIWSMILVIDSFYERITIVFVLLAIMLWSMIHLDQLRIFNQFLLETKAETIHFFLWWNHRSSSPSRFNFGKLLWCRFASSPLSILLALFWCRLSWSAFNILSPSIRIHWLWPAGRCNGFANFFGIRGLAFFAFSRQFVPPFGHDDLLCRYIGNIE